MAVSETMFDATLYNKNFPFSQSFSLLSDFCHPLQTICGALRNLVLFVQFKKVKNTLGGVLLLVKLQAEVHIPVDTGRKLNEHKTFNLRPVSTGMVLNRATHHI